MEFFGSILDDRLRFLVDRFRFFFQFFRFLVDRFRFSTVSVSADFGFRFQKLELFLAPEVVNYEPLSPGTDMWALGVVTYILLSGGSPFLGRNREETFCNITAVNYHFSPNYFANISQHAKDFISRLFVRDMRKRATVENCLTHPWIRGVRLKTK